MRLRSLRGISQEALAEILGVSRTTVMNWETGRAVPRLTLPQIKALCRTLRITLDELPDSFSPQLEEQGKPPLKQLRERAGLTEVDLARELSIGGKSVSVELIHRWEITGKQPNLSISQVAALCEALNVSARHLAYYLESPSLQEENEG